ncbi:beta-propeller domain-containing protein [Candidatus Micrarchaeota archaeon]|nr:beta-propeller domain-containing protein [Candidatus Micrarchaeota archaeon]
MKHTFIELVAAGAIAVVFFAVLFAVGGTTQPLQPGPNLTATGTPTAAPSTVALSGGQFKTFKTWDEAQAFLSTAGSNSYYGRDYAIAESMPLAAAAPGDAVSKSSGSTGSGGSSDYSTTNVQVAGVDEDDTLKNDGQYIYTVTNGQITIIDAYPASQAHIVAVINDSDATYQSIFITQNRLVAFGSRTFSWKPYMEPWVKQAETGTVQPSGASGSAPVASKIAIGMPCRGGCGSYYYPEQSQFMKVFDITERSKPVLLKTIDSKGNLLAARLIGNRVYAVFNENAAYGVPRPLYAVDGEVAPIAPSDVQYIDYPFDNYQFTTVLGQDVDNPQSAETRTIVLTGGASTVYVSSGNAYVTYTRYQTYYPVWEAYRAALDGKWTAEYQAKLTAIDAAEMSSWQKDRMKVSLAQQFLATLEDTQAQESYAEISKREEALRQSQSAPTEATVVHKFALGPAITYVGKGEVPGHLLNQFSMDESDGYFRLATTIRPVYGPWTMAVRCMPDSRCIQPTPTPSRNNVYVLDGSLNTVGKLEDLAPGESIYSARFMGKRAYLVTFRQLDPLFVIGLDDPRNPTLLGKLKIPGYSDYLHPYDETRLIGLGKDAIPLKDSDLAFPLGLKLSMFDVSDVANPKEIASYGIGDAGSDSYALHDHKAFLFNREKGLLVIPARVAVIPPEKKTGDLVHVYGEVNFQGAYVFSTASCEPQVAAQCEFQLRGTVSHVTPEELAKMGDYYYGSGTDVTRSAYIDGTLYTMSDRYVKANDLGTLAAQASVELPKATQPDYPYPYWEGDVIAMPVEPDGSPGTG